LAKKCSALATDQPARPNETDIIPVKFLILPLSHATISR